MSRISASERAANEMRESRRQRNLKATAKVLTLNETRTLLAVVNITIKKIDGEFRVNYKGGDERTAYYTNNITDALGTGIKMSACMGTVVEFPYPRTNR